MQFIIKSSSMKPIIYSAFSPYGTLILPFRCGLDQGGTKPDFFNLDREDILHSVQVFPGDFGAVNTN